MPRLTVDPTGRFLRRDGEPFPLVFDTVWTAFADPTEDEWRGYLAVRRRQGFTALLTSVLPVPHDRIVGRPTREPFEADAEGRPDFAQPDPRYLATARHYLQIARDEFGLEALVTVLWNSYLPGTWGAALAQDAAVMTPQDRHAHVVRVARALGDLEPVFVVAGDDAYDSPEANAGYLEAIHTLRSLAPACLLTTHAAPNAHVPDEIAGRLDLFCYQSGHNLENQDLAWRHALEYQARTPRRPVVNSEPPYELHGRVGGQGRWHREDVRRASWTSVVAGASAGLGYGAHGTWMWAGPTGRFTAVAASAEPLTWHEALALPGALDISLLVELHRRHGLHRLEGAQDLLVRGSARVGASPDRSLVVAYLPDAGAVELGLELRGHSLSGWDLAERVPVVVTSVVGGGRTVVPQVSGTADLLLVAEWKERP